MNVLFVFNSVTTAKRVEKTIAKYGVISKVIHTPKSIGKGGCSHSVSFDENKFDVVKQIVEGSDISISGVYKEFRYNGVYGYREMVL